MRASAVLRTALLALLPALLPLLAAFRGATGPRAVELNLGPGDGPYLDGFAPAWEIGEDGAAHHWTRREARVTLPLEATGPLDLLYRFAPPPGGGLVSVVAAGRVDRFEAAADRWDERRLVLPSGPRAPLALRLQVEGRDPRDLGLRLDFVRFELSAASRLWLRGPARFRAAATVALVALLLAGAGVSLRVVLALGGLTALLAAAGLLADPWLTHRLLTGVPEALVVCGVPGLVLGHVFAARGLLSGGDLRAVAILFASSLLVRLVPLNHPAFFHPDLRTHARIAAHVRHLGWSFFRNPYQGLWRTAGEEGRVASGMWIKSIGGAAVGLPYAVAFHATLGLFDLEQDSAMTATRVAGGAAAALAPVLVYLLARSLRISTLGAWLSVVLPSASAELANAAVPALFGHLLDLTFLIWLAARLGDRPEAGSEPWRAGVGRGAVLLAGCYVVYTSSLVVLTLLLATLVVSNAARGSAGRATALRLGSVLGLGAAAAILLYYWSFVPAAAHTLAAILGGGSAGASPDGPRTFGSVWPALLAWAVPLGAALFVVGSVLWLRSSPGNGPTHLLLGTAVALAVVALARLAAPQVFGWVHDALFAGPLVALTIGTALEALWRRAGAARLVAAALLAAVTLGGLAQYGGLLAARMGRSL
jgi:hypothetical protein